MRPGAGRQIGAITKSGDRRAELRGISAPTLVIHGDRDRMVHPSGGRSTAATIPGARLETIKGMGHDLPQGAWPRLVELIAPTLKRRRRRRRFQRRSAAAPAAPAGQPGMSKVKVAVDGRTAFVSGAASGIGRAVAQRLSAHGCPVAIVDQDEAGLTETADLLAGPVLARRLDVRDRQAQMAFAAEVAEWAPAPLGMVFNNAGVATSQSVAEAAVEDDEWVIDINLGGVVNGVRAFLPILLRQNSRA